MIRRIQNTFCISHIVVLCLIASALEAEVSAQSSAAEHGLVRLSLPPTVYAVPGIEMNIYFSNVLLTLDINDYVIDVDCPRGAQQAERWTFTPSEQDIGQYTLQVEVRDASYKVVARASSKICVVSANAGMDENVSMLFIGDSLTHHSVYPKHVLKLCENGPTLTLIGSHEPKEMAGFGRHEGYGGWTAERFVTHYNNVARQGPYDKRGSPFLYKSSENAKPTLDFARYCRDVNDGKTPDFVTIFLGANDIFSATENTIEQRIDKMLDYYDQLIEMIRTDAPKTTIGVILPVPPAGSQDAFGDNYGAGQTHWQYRRNQHHLVERMLHRYGGGDDDFVSLIPTFTNLDCQHNYPVIHTTWNTQTVAQTIRLRNALHPAPSGYRQIGDTVYCWIKARLAE